MVFQACKHVLHGDFRLVENSFYKPDRRETFRVEELIDGLERSASSEDS
jgi:hypothetical protein